MNKHILFCAYTLTGLLLAVTSCHTHNHENPTEQDEEMNPNIVHMSKEMQSTIGLETEEVKQEPIGCVIRTIAQVQPSQGDEQLLAAKTDGVVALNSSSLTPGIAISTGQAICSINASATAQGNLNAEQQQSRSELERAKKEYERLVSLRSDKLVLESEVAAAKAALENAQATANALQQGFANGKQNVIATKGGYLKQLLVQNGEFVQTGQTIAVITQSRTLQLRAELQADYYNVLQDVCGANVHALSACNDEKEMWTLEELDGRLLSYGHQTNAECPLIPLVFEIKNIGNFLPGTYVEMFIRTRSQQQQLTIPEQAILEEMGSYYVFVQTEDDHFERRLITTGTTDGLRTEVKRGLKLGEHVVSQGAMQLKMQQAVGSVDPHAGHSH